MATEGQATNSSVGHNTFRYFYKNGKTSNVSDEISEEKIQSLATELKSALPWLRQQPVDALIGLISKVATTKWSSTSLSTTQVQGLKFLISWCSAEHLTQIANEALRGNRHFADKFLSIDDYGTRSMRTTSRGLVSHWLVVMCRF